jgi:hypothetical protein
VDTRCSRQRLLPGGATDYTGFEAALARIESAFGGVL